MTGVSVIQMEMDATPAVGNSNDLLELDRELFEQGTCMCRSLVSIQCSWSQTHDVPYMYCTCISGIFCEVSFMNPIYGTCLVFL